MAEIRMRLVLERRHALAVIRALQAFAVPDHVARLDSEPALQPTREAQRGVQLAPIRHHGGVARANVLDPDRRPVEPNGVAAHEAG